MALQFYHLPFSFEINFNRVLWIYKSNHLSPI